VLLHSLVVDCDAIGCPCGVHPIGSAARNASSTG
jgi:hypothetical protein